jgi:hypothetical protein
MSNQIKLAIGSVFALAALVLITTGTAFTQERNDIDYCKKMQQPVSSPSPSYPPGYIRGK